MCVDAAYYTFPSEKYLTGLASQVPSDFQFGLKVTDEITVRRFPNLPCFGIRAGKPNENFLNPDLFNRAFLKPCETIRSNIGVLMFEFSRFYPSDYEHGRIWPTSTAFLATFPGLALRSRCATSTICAGYFACLAKNGHARFFNSRTRCHQ